MWAVKTGGPIYSSPKVRQLPGGDVVVVFGSDDGSVYAADAISGAVRWTFGTAALMRGGFNFSEGVGGNVTVYFGSNDFNVYACDLGSGTHLWTFTTGSYVTATPQVCALR